MMSDAEILVHITAPSKAKDDALYRTLAAGYLNFEPVRTIDLPEDARSIPPGPPPEVLLSPQASFQSVWDNVQPRAARPHPQQGGQNTSQPQGKASPSSWVQPPSEVADSMPDNDVRIDGFTTPTRLLLYYMQLAGPSSDELSASQESARRDATSVYAGNDDLSALLVKGTDSLRQENNPLPGAQGAGQSIPWPPTNYEGSTNLSDLLARGTNTIIHHDCSPPAPDTEGSNAFQHNDDVQYETPQNDKTASESRMDESHVSQTPSSPLQSKRAPPSPKRLADQSRVRSSGLGRSSLHSQSELPWTTIPATQPLGRAGTEPPSSKRLKITPLQGSNHGLGRSISDILPRTCGESADTRHTPARSLAAQGTQTTDWSHETQLTSVEPSPANHKLGPRVPVKLELLMRNFGIEGRYKPRFQARKLREYERGYWLLNLDGWAHQGKIETWGFLGNYICKDGFAGWGTRACRDEDWKWIRLYGWEHIAGELYILLYVASYRRLKAMELTWYDGAGKELIIVGARSDKSTLGLEQGNG